MNSIKFTDEDVEILQTMIENADRIKLTCRRELSGIWLESKNHDIPVTELRLLILSNIQVTVSRVCFKNQRQGTMTSVFEFLKDFCIKNNINQIIIQSVLTKEMANWCIKHGFNPVKSSSIKLHGIVIGDYAFSVNTNQQSTQISNQHKTKNQDRHLLMSVLTKSNNL